MLHVSLDDDFSISQYTAPPPKKRWGKIILIRVFFPPVLLWDGIKFSANYFLGELIGKEMLPRQKNKPSAANAEMIERYIDTTRFTVNKIKITTHDGAQLDTFQISNTDKIAQKDQKYIINFIGNGESFEDILFEMHDDARALNCNVIGFNFRGVMNSKGKPKNAKMLVTDGIAQVQRLLDQGVDQEKIILKGYSLGGAVASQVARYFHRQGIKVNLFNGRSFSSVTNVVVGWVRCGGILKSGHVESLGWKILGYMAKPFIKFALIMTKWEIEADSAYKTLPDTHKDYMVVRSSREDRRLYGADIMDDPVVTHYASIHAALKNHGEGRTKEFVGQRKMYLANGQRSANAHNVSMGVLRDRLYGDNANTFFYNFVRRTGVEQKSTQQCECPKL